MRLPLSTRRFVGALIGCVELVLFSVVTVGVVFSLGNMQLDGLGAFAGLVAGLLFGFTSLNYNRTRAFPAGPVQRRSLVVAELSLRATLTFVAGALLTAALFFFLSNGAYAPTPFGRLPRMDVPVFAAAVPLAFFLITFFTLARALRVLTHGLLKPPRLRTLMGTAGG